MKKLLLTLVMVGICVIFFFSVRGRGKTVNTDSQTIRLEKELASCKEQLEQDYPETPKEVVEIYNKLMGLLYSSSMKDQYITTYVEIVRELYSKELLELNTQEAQEMGIKLSREEQIDSPLIIIGSEVQEVIRVKENDSIKEDDVQVEVTYYMNSGDINRTYHLIKEDDKWKINSWED